MTDYRNDTDIVLTWADPAQAWIEAMPVGNGRLAAMMFGGTDQFRLQVNDSTVWSGTPALPSDNLGEVLRGGAGPERLDEVRSAIDRGDYTTAESLIKTFQGPYSQEFLPFVDIQIETPGLEGATYRGRTLNLNAAIAEDEAEIDGVMVRRKVWASKPQDALLVEIEVVGGLLSSTLRLNSPLPIADRAAADGRLGIGVELPVDGAPQHEPDIDPAWTYTTPGHGSYDPYATAQLVVTTDGDATTVGPSALVVENYSRLLVAVSSSTAPASEWKARLGHEPGPRAREAHRKAALAAATNAAQTPAGELLEAHVADARRLLDATTLQIGRPAGDPIPAEWLLSDVHSEPELISVMFQLGRYLLMSASRPNSGPPANLQGIWNDQMQPAWSSGYTNDINIEMNYWPAETTGLSECHGPLFDLVDVVRKNGADVARELYGTDGWVLHSNTDIWGWALPAGRGKGDPGWAAFTGGGAWLATHFWEHFEHTNDRDFLRDRALPVLTGIVQFYLGVVVPGEGDRLDISPSMSPENKFVAADGSAQSLSRSTTIDLTLARSNGQAYLQALEVLGIQEAVPSAEAVQTMLDRLPPFGIGEDGLLLEWERDRQPVDPQHRHISPLVALYPFDLIDVDSEPELASAAEHLLDQRDDGAMGWSWAWKAACRARLRDGSAARRLLLQAMARLDGNPDVNAPWDGTQWGGLLPNLFSSHPPFQIDGNYGFTAAITEMLVQSHRGRIQLIPALPAQWRDVALRGVRARGGITLDLDVSDGEVSEVRLTRDSGDGDVPVTVVYGLVEVAVQVPLGETVTLNGDLRRVAAGIPERVSS
ncbi:glycoside hydrolase N-terminal domain-containing protein [Leifsonia sp. NPDC056665]|uniref:glycosyl hydrolase family 95 catalytic domain-containing protein n=1 Tax=Leifsonia sp. NPDC056665 TaxID=3345901 RepID=UPI0036C0116E